MTTIEPPTSPEQLESTAGPYDADMKAAGQLTSPTWELELFLSGAFVFAMFQLPGLIEQLFIRLEPHTTETSSLVLFTVALYAKAIAFTLVFMFLIHLVTRAYWVALMGLHSVFPRGIRWDEVKAGPITKEVMRRQTGDMPRSIAKLDNFCSVVFSVGLLIVLLFAFSTTLVGVLGGSAYLLARVFSHGQSMRYYFLGLAGLYVLLPTVTRMIDMSRGDRLEPGSRPDRTLRWLVTALFKLNLIRSSGPMVWTLATNVGRKRSTLFIVVVVTSLIALSSADRLMQSDRLSVNAYDFFGASRGHTVNYRFYENQREQGRPYPRTPSIQSDVISDPYVKLFIPYYPRRDNAALARACPGMKPLHDRGLQIGGAAYLADSLVEPALACIARVHAVTLDGTSRPDLQFAFYENPTTGSKGVLAYIPADSLARGRHVIGVLPVPPAELPTDSAALARAEWKRPLIIPFWR